MAAPKPAPKPRKPLSYDDTLNRQFMGSIYSGRYYRKNREQRNAQTRERMARLRAKDHTVPPEELPTAGFQSQEDTQTSQEAEGRPTRKGGNARNGRQQHGVRLGIGGKSGEAPGDDVGSSQMPAPRQGDTQGRSGGRQKARRLFVAASSATSHLPESLEMTTHSDNANKTDGLPTLTEAEDDDNEIPELIPVIEHDSGTYIPSASYGYGHDSRKPTSEAYVDMAALAKHAHLFFAMDDCEEMAREQRLMGATASTAADLPTESGATLSQKAPTAHIPRTRQSAAMPLSIHAELPPPSSQPTRGFTPRRLSLTADEYAQSWILEDAIKLHQAIFDEATGTLGTDNFVAAATGVEELWLSQWDSEALWGGGSTWDTPPAVDRGWGCSAPGFGGWGCCKAESQILLPIPLFLLLTRDALGGVNRGLAIDDPVDRVLKGVVIGVFLGDDFQEIA
ncbi:hypothetical protein B0H14DRAFT_2583747 [Mycena olivaceomarginata]|nr:hypothetical protein B0H14DRAFT_2583747 [Mycena olivaceomarginata]